MNTCWWGGIILKNHAEKLSLAEHILPKDLCNGVNGDNIR